MAFSPLNPMIVRCKKCDWSYQQKSDALKAFGSCPKCGYEELDISFTKGDPFKSATSKSTDATATLWNKVKKIFRI
ncbi:hypothetical protein HX037_07170 [Ignatzschineria indica]|uniref:hypothetical protein n=1 Tax=Ignatzschineria indica TaxID=472583 RepID=UPI002577B181|nr:hypothetical protein [Ignatzschineria indica]MDM1545654.1 hypothetical protein [Ignatzschineria indica]